jgi:hypothetical protein
MSIADSSAAGQRKAEDVLGQVAAEEEEHAGHVHQRQHHERPQQVVELLLDEAPPLLDAEHVVERRACGVERAGGAVQGGHEAEDEGSGRRVALVQRRPERARERVDELRRRSDVLEVVRGLVHEALLAEEAEHGDGEQHRREERQQRVVGQCGRPLGHRVLLEALERAPEVDERDHRPAAVATRHGRFGSRP